MNDSISLLPVTRVDFSSCNLDGPAFHSVLPLYTEHETLAIGKSNSVPDFALARYS